jgi:hypothetical protein
MVPIQRIIDGIAVRLENTPEPGKHFLRAGAVPSLSVKLLLLFVVKASVQTQAL